MANSEHVEIVMQGAEAIASWRASNPETALDLREAHLQKANLIGADLSRADLSAAYLSRTDLSGAYLTAADLRGANLSAANLIVAHLSRADLRGADLRRTNLSGANLGRAHLIEADLSGAHLIEVNLSGADLSGAELEDAIVGFTSFANVDLSGVQGLGTVRHSGPSTIGIDTLFRSNGKIPDAFLRGCGVPDALIQQLTYVFDSMQPIQLYSCFISYSSQDDAFARRLHARLQAEKLRVWFAPEDMKAGRKIHEQIDEAIRVYDKLLLVLTASSMNSEWVRREIKRAREKERQTGKTMLFPIGVATFGEIKAWKCLDSDTGEDLAEKIREFHIPTDFSQWKDHDAFEKAFANLMRDLKADAAAGSGS